MAEQKQKSTFDMLNSINVSEKTEKKKSDNGRELTYLSWAWAWAEVKKRFPDASYEIIKFDGIPYVYDEKTGYMVYTTVTIDGITHEMWLPVMDGHNCAMKNVPYEVKTKFKTFTVAAATMFDINKTLMRCLTKNLAMFGLGLYIYAGEDLPEESTEPATATQNDPNKSDRKVCSKCGCEIKKDGQYTAKQIIDESIKRLGKPMCLKCWRDMADAKRKAQEAKMDGELQALTHEDAGDRV